MPSIEADKIIGHDIYAKSNIQALDKNLQPGKTFSAGQKIGSVYSYIDKITGELYWMIYPTQNDYNTFNPIYVKHVTGLLEVPDLPGIIAELERKREQQAIQEQGAIQYYVKKYLPYIVGAIALAIIIPALKKK